MEHGRLVLRPAPTHLQHVVIVSGGVGRTIYALAAIFLGVVVWRRPQPPVCLLWLAGVCLAARCAFEAVMCPYYLAPPLILGLVMVSRLDRRRFGGAVLLSGALSVYAYLHLNPWIWWLPIVAGLSGVMALAYPRTGRIGPVAAIEATKGSIGANFPRSGAHLYESADVLQMAREGSAGDPAPIH
jgi:hypothetical protein